jgi:hypothetical protein
MPLPGLCTEEVAPSGQFFLVAAALRLRKALIPIDRLTQAEACGYACVFSNIDNFLSMWFY